MKEYPEPKGFFNEPGFVKNTPENNDSYVEKCVEVYPEWEEQIRACHEYLSERYPTYNIVQIKDKFGGMRFYWDADGLGDEDAREFVSNQENSTFAFQNRRLP